MNQRYGGYFWLLSAGRDGSTRIMISHCKVKKNSRGTAVVSYAGPRSFEDLLVRIGLATMRDNPAAGVHYVASIEHAVLTI